MVAQKGGAIEYPHPLGTGQYRHGAPHMGVWDGVIIEVKPDGGRLGHRHLNTHIHRVGIQGQALRLGDSVSNA
jgi:hypothetical protein